MATFPEVSATRWKIAAAASAMRTSRRAGASIATVVPLSGYRRTGRPRPDGGPQHVDHRVRFLDLDDQFLVARVRQRYHHRALGIADVPEDQLAVVVEGASGEHPRHF